MILPWLASWGALTVACVALAVAVWLGVQLVRLSHLVEGLRACRLPVPLNPTPFQPHMGRCERRDDHPAEQCAPGKEWPK
jgi:hypothetical protein